MFTFGSLFSGIGGMDLGLERAGMVCKWQVEINDYATRVLTKHWPDVPKLKDVRECGAHNLEPVDMVAGGFPCQDVPNAGQREGISGNRSGLWQEMHGIIGELRPRYALIENVTGLFNRGFERVLCDLATLRYDAEWRVIRAADFGLPHRRERVFVIAYPERKGLEGQDGILQHTVTARPSSQEVRREWLSESDVLRRGHGISYRVERTIGLANAVVPQVAEWIGVQILLSESPQDI